MIAPLRFEGTRHWWLSLPLFGAAAVAVRGYPPGELWLALGLIAYAGILWRYPRAWIVALPALLPLLDLARWTGRIFFTEFDLLVLVTLGVGLCRGGAAPLGRGWPPPGAVFGLLALSYLVSAGLGLWPLSPWDANAFSSYYSHYNALRVAKGALWAFGLLWLLAVSIERGTDLRRPFTLGMVAGLAGTLAVVGWERLAFTGLFNFNHAHRVSGPFSALHVGGSSLEGYLVTALPFLGFAIVTTRHRALRLGGLLLFGAGIYGVMVTYSRAGFAALAVIGTLMGVALVRHGLRQAWDRRAYLALGLLFLAGAVTVATPLLRGNFAQERLAQSGLDLATRFAYWRNTLAIMDQGWPTRLFGMGLGRFPETYFWRSAVGTRPATYRFESENGNAFLRLGSGSPLFLNQIVPLQPHRRYSLALDLRTAPGSHDVGLDAPICEIWVRGTVACEGLRIEAKAATDTWQHREIVFDSKAIGEGHWLTRGPTRLNLRNTSDATVDVDNIRLVDEDGHDLLANGGFDRGGARWWFTVDDNWPWHVENFWLHVYFEQGVLGLVGVAALAAMALTAALRRMWRGDLFAGSLFASIAGFLVVGILNSPNDNPQLLLLFLLLCGVAYGMRDAVVAPTGGLPARVPVAMPLPVVPPGSAMPVRFGELDSLRAIAAICVVLIHYRIHFDVHPLPFLANLMAEGGNLAVDFFFVLSGYVLCRAYGGDDRRFRVFANLWQRVARLYPLQILTLLLVAWGQWYLVTVLATKPFIYATNDAYHFLLSATFLNASGLERAFSFNAPSWSVSTEFIVNALFLMLVILPRRLALPLFVALAGTSFALLFGAGKVLTDNGVRLAEIPGLGTINAALVRTSLGFFVGVLLWNATASAIARVHPPGSRVADGIFVLAGLCVAALFGSYRVQQAIPHWDFVLVVLLFPAIIASAALGRTVRRALRWSPLLLLGHASYSIYLLHFPLQLGLVIVERKTGIVLPYGEWWFLVVFVLLTLACAVATYRWFELPAKRALNALVR